MTLQAEANGNTGEVYARRDRVMKNACIKDAHTFSAALKRLRKKRKINFRYEKGNRLRIWFNFEYASSFRRRVVNEPQDRNVNQPQHRIVNESQIPIYKSQERTFEERISKKGEGDFSSIYDFLRKQGYDHALVTEAIEATKNEVGKMRNTAKPIRNPKLYALKVCQERADTRLDFEEKLRKKSREMGGIFQ